jgi:hypothetical protein
MLDLLEQHLSQHQWKSADQETSRLVQDLFQNSVSAAQRRTESRAQHDGLFDGQSQQVLFEIDALWRKHSSGRFGFRSQAKIWFDSDQKDPYQLFQWYRNHFNFSLDACPGHLPTVSHLDYIGHWSEYNSERSFTVEFTFMGKTRDNRMVRHEQRIWFGKLLLHQFRAESHQAVQNPFSTILRKHSTATLTVPHLPPSPSDKDTGFPLKRLIFWSAIAIRLFSLPTFPIPPYNNLLLHCVLRLFMLVGFIFLAGMIVPRSVFLLGKERTLGSVFEVYTPWFFGLMILGGIIIQLVKS